MVAALAPSCTPSDTELAGEFVPGDDWGYGYCLEILVTNSTSTATTNWEAEFDVQDGTIYTTWNGNFSGTTGVITVTPTIPEGAALAAGATFKDLFELSLFDETTRPRISATQMPLRIGPFGVQGATSKSSEDSAYVPRGPLATILLAVWLRGKRRSCSSDQNAAS
jgi:hypothetical protein